MGYIESLKENKILQEILCVLFTALIISSVSLYEPRLHIDSWRVSDHIYDDTYANCDTIQVSLALVVSVSNTGLKSGSVSAAEIETKTFSEFPKINVAYISRNSISFLETEEITVRMIVTYPRETRYMKWDVILFERGYGIIDKFKAVIKGNPPEKPSSCK